MGDHDDDDVDAYFEHREQFEMNIIQVPFPILPLSVAFPKLEQLCIGPDVPYLKPDISTSGQDKWEGIWPHLKVFMFGPRSGAGSDFFAENSRSTLRHLTRLNSLQHISLDFGADRRRPCMFSSSDDHHPLPDLDVSQRSEFQNLRSFTSREFCISADGAKNLLSNAVKANQLISLDIVFPDREDADNHLKGYEWLRGAPSIQTLGCYQYRFLSDLKKDDELLLPQFLATFPNLRTLSIGNYSRIETAQLARVLLAILKVTHLKTIHTSVFQYDNAFVNWLTRVAKGYGVKVFNSLLNSKGQTHLYGARPLQWPMPMSALGG
ncbi:hypothetical protein E4U11_003595 [Claviceps purpurea]|nr:hypothetical protein E4U11_003595 [Claviceps purpurea]